MKLHILRGCLFIMIFLAGISLHAQNNYAINGKVESSEDHEPLIGANISVVNTSLGASTDENGNFSLIKLPAGSYDLQVTYIGYSTKNITVHVPLQDARLQISLSREVLTGPVVTVVATQARDRISPVTFSAMTKSELEARYSIEEIPEIISELPSTTFYSDAGNNLGYNYLSIRGFDQRRVSVLINGIPQNDPEDHDVYWVDFPDFTSNVQSIQVQRGAGSAFYGPAAIGGSINIITNYFSTERELKAFAGTGDFNTKKYSLSYNSGLLQDKFVFFTRASKTTSDGYRNGTWVEFWSYFLGGAYYTKNSSLRLHAFGGPVKDGFGYYGIPKAYNEDNELRRSNWFRPEEQEKFSQPHFEAIHEWRLTPTVTLNNSLFYVRGNGYFDYDGSWGTPEYFRLTSDYGYDGIDTIPADVLIRAYVDNNQIGWLPNFTLKHKSGELVAGGEFRVHRSLHWGRLQNSSSLPDEVVGSGARRYYEYNGAKNIASFYLHETYRLSDKLIAVGDLQFTHKKYRLYNEKFLGNEFSVPHNFINPRFGLNYNATTSTNFYTNISRTSREPRLKNYYDAAEASYPEEWGPVKPQFAQNPNGSYDFDDPLVHPEKLTNFELGTGFRNQAIRAFANMYYMDFQDEIIKSGQVDRFGQPVTGNAEHTTHKGIELSAEVQMLPRLSIAGNVLLSQNKLDKYTVYEYDENYNLVERNFSGNQIAGFPNTLGTIRLTYAWMQAYISLMAKYVGRQYTDNSQSEELSVEPYHVLNLHARFQLKQIGLNGLVLQAKVNNLLNKKYLSYGEGDQFWPAATRNVFVSLQYEY
ncbi:MAG: TonB-dependent receptor [Deferribacteres bacterium]|nr:TonB-dependent receptor [candidate division KSB1 bacterium]MCB9503609.1 TonB-dependent receptor [Deferribacteres bacterium]